MCVSMSMTPRFRILATDKTTGEAFLCFTWTRDAQSGIERAKREAVRFKMADNLTDYRAEPIMSDACMPSAASSK